MTDTLFLFSFAGQETPQKQPPTMSSGLSERYAHSDGLCWLRYSHDGKNIITAGPDSDVSIFVGKEEAKPIAIDGADEILGLAVSKERLFVGPKGTNKVLAFNMDGGNEGQMAMFTSDATCIDVNEDGSKIVAGSADMTLQMIETESFAKTAFEGHEAPVLNVAFDPKEEYILSSSCDGSVKIWSTESGGNLSAVKTIENCWAKSNDVDLSNSSGGICWLPRSGGLFAIAKEKHVALLDRDGFGEVFKFEVTAEAGLADDEVFTDVAIDRPGKLIAAGTTKGQIFVWSLRSKVIVTKAVTESASCVWSLRWNPALEVNNYELSFMGKNGHWGILDVAFKEVVSEKPVQILGEDEVLDADELAGLFDDDDDDNENSFSIHRIKKETGFLEDGDDNSNAIPPNEDTNASNATSISKAAGDPEMVKDDKGPAEQPAPVLDVDIQEPFQPGSTPVHLESRFMVWNSVGIVECYNSEVENKIEVEFHDAAVHHPIHLGNSQGFTMADLSKEAVVLASEADEAEGAAVSSKLMVHHFGSSDLNKDWTVDMPDKEDILAVCCGTGWVWLT